MIKKMLIILFLLPFPVFASKLELNCSRQENTKNLTCIVLANTNTEVSAVHFETKYSGVEFVLGKSNTFDGEIDSYTADLYTDNNKKNEFEVATMFYSLTDKEYTIELKNIVLYDNNFKEVKVKNVKSTTKKEKKANYIGRYVIILLIIACSLVIYFRSVNHEKN